jgi:hypothetical protein
MNKAMKQRLVLFTIFTLLCLFSFDFNVSAQGTVVKAEASTTQPRIGDTLTVNIKILDVQNLFGVDLTLTWDPAVLKVISVTPELGVESHLGGVLLESSEYPIYVQNNDTSVLSGYYHLLATSTGSSTSSFSGSGTVVTITFNVTSTGPSQFSLQSELSDKAPEGGTANLIDHSDIVDTVNAVIPEFPTVVTILLLLFLATAVIAASTRNLKSRSNTSLKKASHSRKMAF